LGYCESYFVKRKLKSSPKASLIIAVYKNTVFLKAVLDSLTNQTEKDFEVIIAEDGESPEMKNFLNDYPFEQSWQHITQKDEGWRKNHAMNKAIIASKSEWLIFIDGDCVLHPRFVEMHLRNADKNYILAGKRVKLDKELSALLIENKVSNQELQEILLRKMITGKGKIKFIEEGIFTSPDSILGFIPALRKLKYLKGCNMSFSKKAITTINGFDEDYTLPAIGEDIDLSWRFEKAGFKHKSVRNLAVQYHLFHHENWSNQDDNIAKMVRKKENNEFICRNGLIKNWL
jgi:GT2 family glycosyltransferase